MEQFQEDRIERECLTRKPTCFLIVGKPGCGKTTLAQKLSVSWNSQLIDGTTTIDQAMREDTELGSEARDMLLKGEELPNQMVVDMIESKLNSPEVQHYGYVLDGIPLTDSEWMSPGHQMAWLFGSQWKPDIIINIKVPDADLLRRISGQKVDPLSGVTYTKSILDPPKPAREQAIRDIDEDEEDDGVAENEDDEDHDVKTTSILPPAVLERLVRRIEDYEVNASKRLQQFKKNVLHCIEGYMAAHPRQFVIELDGNLSPDDLFKALAIKLTALTIPKAPAPKRLINDEEEGEEVEGMDDDSFLDKLARTEIIGSQFRWKRSRWGRYCPVELARGNMVQGRPEFSVGFLDKLYCLSSVDALMDFTRCPRRYLLDPLPMVPCKICIVGPPLSGKTTLAAQIANHYQAEVINVWELVTPLREKAKQENIAKVEAEETAKAISLISNKLKEQDESGDPIHVSENHPEVVAIVTAAVDKLSKDLPVATNEMMVEALKLKVKALDEAKAAEGKQKRFGGWIVDGFPETREQWSIMLEQDMVPDHVLVLGEPEGKEGLLNERVKSLAKDDPDKATDDWSKKFQEFRQHWMHLSEAIKGKAIDPIEVDCTQEQQGLLTSTVQSVEAVFWYHPVQFSALEEDADVDDDPRPGDDDDEIVEEETELQKLSRKPWGVSKHYCPVALKDMEVLWPGNADHALKYRDRLYYFYSEEAKEAFELSVEKYASFKDSLKVPPVRLFLLGPSGAGKTLAGHNLAQKHNIFHVSFKQYLQELIMPKLKRPFIGESFYDDDGVPALEKEEEEEEEEAEEESEFKEPLDDEEMALYQYLKEDTPLSDEQLISLVERFWQDEPYKSTGFIMEGFPTSDAEVRTIAEKGMFVDAVVMMEVSSANVIKRFGPGRLDNWKEKRDGYLQELQQRKDNRRKAWEEDREARKQELIEDHEQSKSTKEEEDEEPDEEEEDEFREKLKEIEDEVYEEQEDPQVLEEEETAKERINGVLIEKAEEQTESVQSLKDVFSELLIPVHLVDANRTKGVVFYSLCKSVCPYIDNRPGLLLKSSLVTEETARVLTDHGYKHLSSFGYTCPVQMLDAGDKYTANQPVKKFPIVLGQRVYYLSSEEARICFLGNPHKYTTQVPPLPFLPPKIAIIGPPKCGKSSVVNQLVSTLGVVKISIGDALRYQLLQFPESHLTEQIKSYLMIGETIPEELCVAALERRMLEAEVNTRGMVLDGWPQTKSQVELLRKHYILPMIFIELTVSEDECITRAYSQRLRRKRDEEPLLDNTTVQAAKVQSYFKHIADVRHYYQSTHRNWYVVDGETSRWKVWDSVLLRISPLLDGIQQYIDRIPQGKAASVHSLCITPEEFAAHMGEYESYCPVSLSLRGELVDCSVDNQYSFVAEYKTKYYRFSCEEDLDAFLSSPDGFVSPDCKAVLPPVEKRPKLLTEVDKSVFPKEMELQGFCPVTYINGGCLYEALVPGSPYFAAEYKGKIYCFCGEDQRQQFMRLPEKYSSLKIPTKLPPLKQPMSLNSLPILGYLEQTVATTIINALTAAGCFKPKLPFKDAYSSALTYVAYHLKAHNPNSPKYLREKYRKKLHELENECLLLKDLSSNMLPQYQNPKTRPVVFNSNLTSFLSMKQTLLASS